MKAQEKEAQRKVALTEAGFDIEDEEVQSLFSLEDATFDSVVAIMKKKYSKKSEEKEEEKPVATEETEETDEVEVTAEVFEEVESSEATLVESEETDPVETTRASVADWLSKNVLTK